MPRRCRPSGPSSLPAMSPRRENEPPPVLDTPAALTRMIIEASQDLRRIIEAEDSTGKPGRTLKATAELYRLMELRLALAGVLQSGPGRPRNKPGRPAAEPAPHQHEHPGVYEVAAALRAALEELPETDRAGAAAILAEAFPALGAEPLEPERLRPATPAHLKPPPQDTPPWLRQMWGQ